MLNLLKTVHFVRGSVCQTFSIIIIIIIIAFILIQEKCFTESLLNSKTSTGPNSAQLPFLYVITQTLETVNVDIELDHLHLLKTNLNNYT